VIAGESGGQGGETFGGPALLAVGGAGHKDDVAVRFDPVVGQELVYSGGGLGVGGQLKVDAQVGDTGGAEDFHIAIDHVGAVGALLDFVGVEEVGKLPAVGYSEALLAAGDTGEKGRSEQALEVEYGVKSAVVEAAKESEELDECPGIVPGLAQVLAVEWDNAGQIGVAFKQWGVFSPNEPANLGIGKAPPQSRQGRQYLDGITEGAGFYNQNVPWGIGHF